MNTEKKCNCEEWHAALLNGHPNPEGEEEYREFYGHYATCPMRWVNSRAEADLANLKRLGSI